MPSEGDKDGRQNEGSGEKENKTRGKRGDERRVKKQRANNGQGAAGGRWQRSLFSGEIKMLI